MSSSGGDSSVFERFLNTTDDSGAGFKLVNASSPLKWGLFGKSVIGSILAGFFVGIQYSIDAILGVPATILRSAGDWISREAQYFRYPGGRTKIGDTGLIPTVENAAYSVINAAWEPVAGLGWLAYPIAAAEVLVSLYIVVWAFSYVREEVL